MMYSKMKTQDKLWSTLKWKETKHCGLPYLLARSNSKPYLSCVPPEQKGEKNIELFAPTTYSSYITVDVDKPNCKRNPTD